MLAPKILAYTTDCLFLGDKELFIFFFFSSRRRHTRLQGDWSSDVCSSDLEGSIGNTIEGIGYQDGVSLGGKTLAHFAGPGPRSEERRVGKECRSRWSPY